MAITGTGTETDPYLVSTAEELKLALSDSNTYPGNYVALSSNIDKVSEKLNNTQVLPGKTLLGRGFKIRNIYIPNGVTLFMVQTTSAGNFTLKNVHFENIDIYATGCLFANNYSTNNRIDIYNCTLHIHLLSLADTSSILSNCNNTSLCMYDSEILVFADKATAKAVMSPDFYLSKYCLEFYRTRIVIDMQNFTESIDDIYCMQYGKLIDSYYIVKLATNSNNNCSVYLYDRYSGECQIKHSYVSFDNCKRTFFSSYDTANITTDMTQSQYINGLLLNCGENSGDGFTINWLRIDFNTCLGVKQLTTAQLKDPDYLNSIYWYVNKEGEL